jgi:Protein of unknown function (DUF1488)
METATTALDFAVSSDRKHVMFVTTVREREVPCTITRDALEQHFWVPAGASDARLLRAFADGRKRIIAVAERKWLKRTSTPGAPIGLAAADFTF